MAGRLARQWLTSPESAGVPGLPLARACIMLTSPGHLTLVSPWEGPEFIKSPLGEQVLSALTSQLAAKQPDFIISSCPTPLGRLSSLRHAWGYMYQPKEGGTWLGKSNSPAALGSNPTPATSLNLGFLNYEIGIIISAYFIGTLGGSDEIMRVKQNCASQFGKHPINSSC